MPSDEEVTVIKTNKMYSAPGPGNKDDARPTRYSPVFPQRRPDVAQPNKPRDEPVRPAYAGPQPKQPVQPRRPSGKPQEIPVVAKPPEFNEDVIAPRKSVQQRSSPQGMHNGPSRPYQNGYGGGPYDNDPYDEDDDLIVLPGRATTQEGPPVDGDRRPPSDEELRYRSPFDERVDTPQSGRLSHAMMVRERFEDDGEFDQEVTVVRGLDNLLLF